MAETTVRRISSGDEGLSSDVAFDEYLKFANAYHTDAVLRAETVADPAAVLSKLGFDLPPGVKPEVALNTEETFHVVFPPDPNVALEDEALTAVAGGNTAGSASTIGCAGSASSLPSCAFSVSSLGSAGTAGSAS
jgi:hypothetical protein